jgi:hypothetical protein
VHLLGEVDEHVRREAHHGELLRHLIGCRASNNTKLSKQINSNEFAREYYAINFLTEDVGHCS